MKKFDVHAVVGAVLMCLSIHRPVLAQESSRPLPASTTPGIVEIQERGDGPVFVSLEQDGWEPVQTLRSLPLARIKGNRTAAESNKIMCYPATMPLACILDVTVDSEREIWLYRATSDNAETSLHKLPNQIADDMFWAAPRHALAGNGRLVFATFGNSRQPATLWVENGAGAAGFTEINLRDSQERIYVRPSFEATNWVGLALVMESDGEWLVTPAKAFSVLAVSPDGSYERFGLPSDCEVLGAFRDTLICADHPRGGTPKHVMPQYRKTMRLQLPEGIQQDNARDGGAVAFQVLDDAILFIGAKNGVRRPYLQRLDDRMAGPALEGENACVADQEHVEVYEVSAKGSVVLLRIIGPTSPLRLIAAPVEEGRIKPCSAAARTIVQHAAAPFDTSAINIDRVLLGGEHKVPVTLVSGTGVGPLKGHVMMATYAHAAMWMPEQYLGAWLDEWVLRGGTYAFVHLPGGGGYGADWAAEGFGIAAKIRASAMLDDVSADLVGKGYGAHGSISVLTSSGGGPLAAHAVLRSPDRYAVLVLRAACLALEASSSGDCTRTHDYGNWNDADDRDLIAEFEPLPRILGTTNFPSIVFGLPERDDRLALSYQRRMVAALQPKNPIAFTLSGTNHASRAAPDVDTDWVRLIARTAIKASDDKSGAGP